MPDVPMSAVRRGGGSEKPREAYARWRSHALRLGLRHVVADLVGAWRDPHADGRILGDLGVGRSWAVVPRLQAL